jgi:hypothetical protein
MKLNLYISTAILFLSGFTMAQNLTLEFLLEQKRTEFGNYQQEINLSGYRFQDFIALSLKLEGDDLIQDGVRIKVQSRDSVYQLKQFHEELVEGLFVSELLYLPVSDAGILKFTFDYNPNINVQKLKGIIRFFSPGGLKIKSKPLKKKSVLADFSDCNCLQPDFVSRSIWGGSFGLNENIYKPPASYTNVTHLIVHHSAGTNTSTNWPGVVASIFDFHVNTNGWQDIGYNWLIDPNGVIYEGRGVGDNVRGAHMCGYNSNTMGVCILGTYTSVSPSQNSIEAIKNLLSWKSCKEEIDPVGSGQINSYSGFMKNISGHKDGCAPNYTECPGVVLYSQLDSIRYSTKNKIDNECSGSSAIQNYEISEPVIIFPNPVSGILYYQNIENLEIEELIIFNNFGEIVFKNDQRSNKSGKLDVSKLKNGIFYVMFKSSYGHNNIKFIKID